MDGGKPLHIWTATGLVVTGYEVRKLVCDGDDDKGC